jgi:hypothetical protein
MALDRYSYQLLCVILDLKATPAMPEITILGSVDLSLLIDVYLLICSRYRIFLCVEVISWMGFSASCKTNSSEVLLEQSVRRLCSMASSRGPSAGLYV